MVNLIVSSNSSTHEDASFALRALSGVSDTFVSTCVETSRAFFRGRLSGMGKAMSGKCQETRVLVVKYAVVVEECGGREGYEGAVAWLGGGKHPRLRHVISSRSGSVPYWALTSPPILLDDSNFQGISLSPLTAVVDSLRIGAAFNPSRLLSSSIRASTSKSLF